MISEKQKLHITKLAEIRRGKRCMWMNERKFSHTEKAKRLISIGNKGKLLGKKKDIASIKRGAEKRKRGSFFDCLTCGSEFWRQPSAIKKGYNKFCARVCYLDWQIGKPKISGFKLKSLSGKNNPSWKGGITPINTKIRNSKEYKEWRSLVFNRDKFICQECGDKSIKGNAVLLEAHHIKPFATHIELRLDIRNGITLCKKCHSSKPKGKKIYA